jgi:hypothetical protein
MCKLHDFLGGMAKRSAAMLSPLTALISIMIGIILLMPMITIAASPQQQFDRAQALFDSAQKKLANPDGDSVEARREFHQSAVAFAALADQGVESVNLFVNTGNAHHFAGDNPRALLWYLRAEILANTPETRSGLTTLRRVCKADRWPEQDPSIGRALMSWHYDLPRRLKQILLWTIYPLGCLMTIISLFIKRRSLCRKLGITLIIIGGILGVSDLVTATLPSQQWAVVLQKAKGYAGDGQGYSVVIEEITPGQEVKIIENRKKWIKIQLPNQTKCWIDAKTCEKV